MTLHLWEDIAKLIELYKDEYNFEAVIPVSVVKQTNLDAILDEIEKHLKVGPAYYDIEEYTDQTMRQLVEETIREKALKLLEVKKKFQEQILNQSQMKLFFQVVRSFFITPKIKAN